MLISRLVTIATMAVSMVVALPAVLEKKASNLGLNITFNVILVAD